MHLPYTQPKTLVDEEYVYYLYREKKDEARKLREAINAFIKAVGKIPTPSEKSRRRRK